MEDRSGVFLLAAVGAKYIHSNLAVYSLDAYCRERGFRTEAAEYTINQPAAEILRDIYLRHPAVAGFSCYIWNMTRILEIIRQLHQILPDTLIVLGGPEVSWNPEERLMELPFVNAIMVGEGEETCLEMAAALQAYMETQDDADHAGNAENTADRKNAENTEDTADRKNAETIKDIRIWESGGKRNRSDFGRLFEGIPGLCLRDADGRPYYTGIREPLSMDDITFPYDKKDRIYSLDPQISMESHRNKIIYYESSRGCPFRCSYCLSSVEKSLRFRSLDLVYRNLQFFIDCGVPQVKFVDRTFNCRHEHAVSIWTYILEHDRGLTNFHFEIGADLLREEDFEIFKKMRPGLIQLEIGVQSTNPATLKEIGRQMDLDLLRDRTARVHRQRNIHQHLDLIAGLPYEDLASFAGSFDDVYAMKPDQLQLGFLKVLHGTYMEKHAREYNLCCQEEPVYEVLSTRWLTFDDILLLHDIEAVVEDYYNSGQFSCTLAEVVPYYNSAFDFYRRLGIWMREKGYRDISLSRMQRYDALRAFLLEEAAKHFYPGLIDALLSVDYCLRESLKKIPDFLPDQTPYKQVVSDYFAWASEFEKKSCRELRGQRQALVFRNDMLYYVKKAEIACGSVPVMNQFMPDRDGAGAAAGRSSDRNLWLLVFDYASRDPLSHNADVKEIQIHL
ncbi:MAG: DUF4080 domain-containing protein [Lachnospiraceae bacterium]